MENQQRYAPYLFWLLAVFTSYVFNLFNIPAAWLLGSLTAGIFYGLTFGALKNNKKVFPFALCLIGLNLGSMLNLKVAGEIIGRYGFAILIGLVMTLVISLGLGIYLYKKTNLDFKTAIFSFIPGGASEVLSIAEENGADIRIVAAFHSARLILFVTLIPLLVGSGFSGTRSFSLRNDLIDIPNILLPLVFTIIAAFLLNRLFPIPVGTLLYSTLITIIWNFIDPLDIPLLVAGIGQILIGATIGLRFDRTTLKYLWEIRLVSSVLLFAFITLCLINSAIFSVLSEMDIRSSVLGWVPAGAGEMASTAIFLNLDETSVITIQLIRLYTVMLTVPLLMRWLKSNDS